MAKSREEYLERKRRLQEISERLPNPFNQKAVEKRDGSDQSKRKKGQKKHKVKNEKGQEDEAREMALKEIKKPKKKKAKEEDAGVEQKGKYLVGKKRKREKEAGKDREREKGEVSESLSLSAPTSLLLSTVPVDQQLQFFCKQFEHANKFKISPLELEPVKETCFAQLPEGVDQDVEGLCKHVKDSFGPSWKWALCDGKLVEGEIDAGCPAILIISTSAIRSLELLRGVRPLTNECRPAKLFAKHMKVDDQVSLLKNRVNIASGTPSRIKKLMDMESLGISRLSLVVLDMHRDAKGFNLLSLPQVRDEFWELYRSHLHGRLIGGDLRLCFYGSILEKEFRKILARAEA